MSKTKKRSQTETKKLPHANSVIVSLSSNIDERRDQKKNIITLLRRASYYRTEGAFKRIGKTTYSLNAGILDKQLIRQIQNNLSRV
ncbi:MAG TPA: hypothetical protein PK048_02630 [Candidatus Absconditabacterales bacterium]|nr:hypothetical protein [Candidatus Absconditabacterales bacterium]